MPRQQFDGNPRILPGNPNAGDPNPAYGTCDTVTLIAPAGTASTPDVYDVYVTNVGTGAMTFTFNFVGGANGFSNARMPVEDHTTPGGVVTVESGEFFNLDAGGCLHIVLDKANSATPETANITVENGLKTHITAATTNNDYITLVGNAR